MPLQPFRGVPQVDPGNYGMGALQNIQVAKQNALLNIGAQKKIDEYDANAPVREAKRGTELNEAAAADLHDGLKQAYTFLQLGNIPAIEQMAQAKLAANPNSPHAPVWQEMAENVRTDPNGLADQLSQMFADEEQGETFKAATPEEYAALGPDVVGAQISSSGKLVNVQKRQDSAAPEATEPLAQPRPITTEIAQQFGISEEDRGKFQIGSTGEIELLPTPTLASNETDAELKPYSKMGAENRVKLGLIRNADRLAVQAENKLFGAEGDHHGWSSANPYSESGIAKEDMREALQSMLRAVSGAAIPDTEIEREVEGMLPTAFDTNETALAKWGRAKGKIALLHSALTGGFEVPDDLKLSSGGTIQNAADDMKTIGDKTYIRIGNSWFEANNG